MFDAWHDGRTFAAMEKRARRRAAWLPATALAALAVPAQAQQAPPPDVRVSTDATTGLNLDGRTGSTVAIDGGVTVSNATVTNVVIATTGAWSLTNNGTVSADHATAILLGVTGSSVINQSRITAASGTGITMNAGGSVDNRAGATISSGLSAIVIGTSTGPASAAGTVTNAGTITQTGTASDLVLLRAGGIVTNMQGGVISANNSSNAVSVGQGVSRTVTNAGTITNSGASFATGVLMQGGASTLTNTATGRISGTYNGVYASASAPLTFTNAGTIESTGPNANARAVEATGGGTFVNSGTIRSASSDGLYLARAGTVTNSGTISGAVRAINFSGNFTRTLILDTGSVLNGLVQGGTGIDNLVLTGSGSEGIAKFLSFETLSMQGVAWQINDVGTFSTSADIQSGTLTVAGTLTSPAISIRSGGTLAGTGTLIGTTTILDGGTLSGRSGQTLTIGNLILSGGAHLAVALGNPSTTRLFDVRGDLTLGGALDITDAGGFGLGVYRLFDVSGSVTNNGLAIGAVPNGIRAGNLEVQSSVANQVNLILSGPDPIQFWNGTTTIPTGHVEGGSGTWSNGSATNWTNAAGTRADPWNANFAVFQGGRGTANGTVTIDNSAGAVSVAGMQFIGTGWTLTGNALTLAGVDGTTRVRVGDGSTEGAADTATVAADLIGTARLVKDDLGTLILAGSNRYGGGTTINAGTLQIGNGAASGSIVGDVVANATLAFARSDDTSFAGVISGTGTIRQSGGGRLTLTGSSAGFSGETRVESGALAIDGQLGGALRVLSGGRLQGNGTAGAVSVASGGVLAPGNSIGTLSLGSVTFAAGSIFEVEVDAAGHADRVAATGTATIQGGTVRVLAGAGTYARATDYTILTANGGVSGSGFASVTSNLAFLTPTLAQNASSIVLRLSRNDIDFQSIGGTFNQRSAGHAVEALGQGTLYDAVLRLDAPGARAAFDAVSGEIQPSTRTALIEDNARPRDAVLRRLSDESTGRGAWLEGFGNWGTSDGDDNAAAIDRNAAGVIGGIDASPGNGPWRLGLAGGYTHSDLESPARGSTAHVDQIHVIGYAGAAYGPIRLRVGGGYAHATLETSRTARFGGFADSLHARYDGSVVQGFGELGYRVSLGSGRVEPFAGLVATRVRTDGFAETGGKAALNGDAEVDTRIASTLGLRASTGGNGPVSVQAMAGWRHAFGDVTPLSRLRFVGGSDFAIAGTPLSRDGAQVQIGLGWRLTPGLSLSALYGGVLGDAGQDHTARGGLRLTF